MAGTMVARTVEHLAGWKGDSRAGYWADSRAVGLVACLAWKMAVSLVESKGDWLAGTMVGRKVEHLVGWKDDLRVGC